LLFVAARRRLPPPARFALVVFFGALLPVSNALSLGFRFADRYQLLALLALIWPCAALLAWLLEQPARAAATVALSLSLATAAAVQARGLAGAWRDSLTLWTHASRAQPRAFYAWLKLGESQRALHRHGDAVASYTRAIELEPQSALGYAGLFLSVARRAEEQGRVPPGSAERWTGRIGPALASPPAADAFAAELRAAGCLPCAHSVLWLALRKYPRSDAELEALARAALPADPGAALLLLHEQRSPTSGSAELRRAARARLLPQPPR
jgi:tetratricopeptide (TPR) repeat protein